MKRLSILVVACVVLTGLSQPFGGSPVSAATATTAQALSCGLGGNQTMTITGTAPDTAVQNTPFTVDLQPAQAVANGGAIKNLVWYFQAPTGSSIVAGSATTTGTPTGPVGTISTEISGSLVMLKASGEIPNGGTFRPPNLRFQLNPTGAAGTNLQMKVQASKAYSLTALGTININCTASSAVAFTNTTIIAPPGAPTIGTATAGNGQANLTWTAPSSIGGSAITGYTVTPYLGATAQTPQVFASTATTQTITGLTNGSAYTFKVAATNAAGTGTQSAASNAVTPVAPATVPGAPTIGTATAGDANATVTWTAPASNGGSAVTGYVVTPYIGASAQTAQTFNSTATSQNVTGLTNGTAYTFRVAAVNAIGTGAQSAASNEVTPIPAATAPGAPTGVTGSAGNGQATVSWTAPASNGGSPITGYVVTPYIGATAQTAQTFNSTATPQNVTGLTNGTAYTFRVAAVNAVGTGAQSAASNSVTPVGVPGVPTGLLASAGNGQATLGWSAPASNGGSPITGYVVTPYVGSSDRPAQFFDATATLRTITGLTNGTTYTFRVLATNAAGTGMASAESNAVTPATTPDAPTAVTASPGNAQALVSWTAPASNGGSAITGYVVTPYIGATAQTAQTFNSTATSQTVTGLTNGTAYTFRVAAVNAVGTGAGSAASAAVTPVTTPGAPTIGSATGGNAQATVTWTAPASNGGTAVTGYVVTPYIGATAQTAQTFNSTATTQNVTGLTNGTAYTFRVAAVNAVGTGSQSAASNAVTPATTPGAPTIGAATAGNAQATVSWTAPASNGGSAVTGYVVTPYIGATAQTAQTFNSTATTQVITGLANGTSYTFRAAAVNAVGTGTQSAATNAVTPTTGATAPGAPTAVSGLSGDGQVTVSWAAPVSNGGSAITGYVVTPYIGATAQTPVPSAGTGTSKLVTGLTNGTAYTFKVAAVNAVGTGADSSASSPVTPATVPGAPTIGAVSRGNAQATVSWTAPASNGGSAVTGYVVTPYIGASAQTPQTFNSTATTQNVTGLANGTAYTFKVAAVNAVGTGAQSAASSAVTPATTPGAPTGAAASRGDSSAVVSWVAPASNGGSAITGYRITPYQGATALTPVTVASSPTSTTIGGLVNGTGYTFTVAAINDVGTGAASAPSVVVVPATTPGSPTNVTGTRGDTEVAVSWTAPASNGGNPITAYVVTPYIGATAQTPVTSTGTGTSKVITGLANGTAYTFKVAATNDVGTGSASAASAAVTPAGLPSAPLDLGVEPGDQKVDLTWNAPASSNGSSVTGYVVTPYIGSTAQTPVTFESTATRQWITGLTNGTAYTFKVAAVNAVGTGAQSAASAEVTPATTPGAPTAVTGELGDAQVTVSWTAPSSDGGNPITGYVVTPYIGATAQTPVTSTGTGTSKVITGLANGTAYTFTVAAVNEYGTGAASAPSATVTPRPPYAPFASWEAFVTRQYLDVTNTAPASSALAQWAADLGDGSAEKGDLIEALRRGTDNTNAVDPAVRLYRAFFNRIPDPSGFDFWVARRRTGSWTLVRMADQFAGSSEFKRKYGTLTNRQFVTRIYTDVLGRPADADGVDYWTRQLDLGRRNRGSVMVGFSESSEFKTKQAATTDVAVAYLFLLGRAPSASEVSAWVTAQQGGTTQAELATALLETAEYRTIAG